MPGPAQLESWPAVGTERSRGYHRGDVALLGPDDDRARSSRPDRIYPDEAGPRLGQDHPLGNRLIVEIGGGKQPGLVLDDVHVHFGPLEVDVAGVAATRMLVSTSQISISTG